MHTSFWMMGTVPRSGKPCSLEHLRLFPTRTHPGVGCEDFQLCRKFSNTLTYQLWITGSKTSITSLFLIPVLDAPPPPPRTSRRGVKNAQEYTGNDGRECSVCRGRIVPGQVRVALCNTCAAEHVSTLFNHLSLKRADLGATTCRPYSLCTSN
jgi:hypothetical protein